MLFCTYVKQLFGYVQVCMYVWNFPKHRAYTLVATAAAGESWNLFTLKYENCSQRVTLRLLLYTYKSSYITCTFHINCIYPRKTCFILCVIVHNKLKIELSKLELRRIITHTSSPLMCSISTRIWRDMLHFHHACFELDLSCCLKFYITTFSCPHLFACAALQ